MALRPVFLPKRSKSAFVMPAVLEFQWFPGFSVSQKQKSIASLHQAARHRFGIEQILEVSSKSPNPLGVALSAFNLSLALENGDRVCVEAAFQASKKFTQGGPFLDLLQASPKDAKRDPRLRNSGALVSFVFAGETWSLQPRTAFYDWLYLNALQQNPDLAKALLDFQAFTDIEFNPEKSLNCQARSCALYVSLARENLLERALSSRENYLATLNECASARP